MTQNVGLINRIFFAAVSDKSMVDKFNPLKESESHRELEMVGVNGL